MKGHDGLHVAMVEAMQMLKDEIEALKKRVYYLEMKGKSCR